jgi:hypothetical protein
LLRKRNKYVNDSQTNIIPGFAQTFDFLTCSSLSAAAFIKALL